MLSDGTEMFSTLTFLALYILTAGVLRRGAPLLLGTADRRLPFVDPMITLAGAWRQGQQTLRLPQVLPQQVPAFVP